MRGYLASSIGFTCAALLALPCAIPAAAAGTGARGPSAAGPRAEPVVPGSTQSLPLLPLTRAAGAVVEAGLSPRTVRSFSLVGVVWDDPGVEFHGRVEVRTRASRTRQWSAWQQLETHRDGHGPDPDTAEGRSGKVRGGTEPLWVGDSDGVEVRVRAEADDTGTTRAPALPDGLRVELVDPGAKPRTGAPGPATHAASPEPSDGGAPDTAAGAGSAAQQTQQTQGTAQEASHLAHPADPVNSAHLAHPARPVNPPTQTVTPVVDTAEQALDKGPEEVLQRLPEHAKTHTAPRPKIVTRSGWGADESLREQGFVYTDSVRVAFVHHTASGNTYTCAQAPSVVRSIYRYHVVSNGWRDIGYNFLVDKCGTIYEGRAGGIDKPVLGAHTLGFNNDSMGVAVIGTYSGTEPSADTLDAVGALAAWKLGLYGMDPAGTTYLESGGGNLYPKGAKARLNVISGHRDGYLTDCPGQQLYGKLGTVRSTAARLQGR